MRRTLQQAHLRTPERFIVTGPPGWEPRLYTDYGDAVGFAQRCSKEHRGKTCRVAYGWPGSERVIVECSKNKCKPASLAKKGKLSGRRSRRSRRK